MDLFVGSLPFKLKEAELKSMFEQFGAVNSVRIVIDNVSRQSKGFAFVEMDNEEEALMAIAKLNGTEVMSRSIVVNKAQSKIDTKSSEREARAAFEPKHNNNRIPTGGYSKKFKGNA
jgi:RNA recognition motif-containing protein